MTNVELQAKLKTFPDAAEIFTEGGLVEDGDINLDDDGDIAIGPFLDDEEADDLDLDAEEDDEEDDIE